MLSLNYQHTIGRWNQMLKYQELKDQISSASHRLWQLDIEMHDREEYGRRMSLALKSLSTKELEVLDVDSKMQYMRGAQKIIRRVALMNETRTMIKDLGD